MAKNNGKDVYDLKSDSILQDLKTTDPSIRDRFKIIANKNKVNPCMVREVYQKNKYDIDLMFLNQSQEQSVHKDTVVEEEEVEEKQRKEKIILNENEREMICEFRKAGQSIKEIARCFDVSISTISRVLKEHNVLVGGKIISQEQKDETIMMYIDGASYVDIEDKLKISAPSIAKIISAAKADGIITEDDRMSRKRNKAKNAGNKNAPDIETMTMDELEKMCEHDEPAEEKNEAPVPSINVVDHIDVPVEEVKKTDSELTSIIFANDKVYGPFHPYKNEVLAGMIGSRHDMKVQNYVFPNTLTDDQMANTLWQLKTIDRWITDNFHFGEDGNAKEYLNLYATGCQIVFANIIRCCLERHVNLKVSHFDPTTNDFTTETVVFDQFGDNMQSSFLEGVFKTSTVYLYNCSLADITDNDDLYLLSLNTCFDDSATYKINYRKSVKVICNKKEDANELFLKFIDIIENNKGIEKNSVFVNYFSTARGTTKVGDSRMKGYNYYNNN